MQVNKKLRAIVEWLVAVILVLAACVGCWLIGDVCGIQYQQDKVKLPSGSGIANYFELNGESEVPLEPLGLNQSIVVVVLMDKGSVDCWIETETGEAITEVMSFDQDSSFVFHVPSKGAYVMMLRGDQASFNVSMVTYDREQKQ